MSKKSTATPEEKLRALYDLQIMDSKIDEIRIVRGELPLEVQDLEDEVLGLTTRLNKMTKELDDLKTELTAKKFTIEDANIKIKKYTEQQNSVRNNREYDSLSKEIEFQGLEIELAEKRIKEFGFLITTKEDVVNTTQEKLNLVQESLDAKKGELDDIISQTKREEDILLAESEKLGAKIDDRLLKAYHRIRSSSRNGLAIVPIDRESSAGSFIKLPAQRQIDIAARKKIIVDEHSGRILVDNELAAEETEKIEKILAKVLKK